MVFIETRNLPVLNGGKTTQGDFWVYQIKKPRKHSDEHFGEGDTKSTCPPVRSKQINLSEVPTFFAESILG